MTMLSWVPEDVTCKDSGTFACNTSTPPPSSATPGRHQRPYRAGGGPPVTVTAARGLIYLALSTLDTQDGILNGVIGGLTVQS
jgi:hypothetical protein